MLQTLVGVPMGMWLASRVIRSVTMMMGFVVNMSVGMLLPIMSMFVIVLFRRMEPNAHGHESTRGKQLVGDTLMQRKDGDYSAKEGRRGKIRGRARSSQMT